jgi:hypothetical protein
MKQWFKVYKRGLVEELYVDTAATDGNCLFQRFCPFATSKIIKNNVLLHIMAIMMLCCQLQKKRG